MSILANANAIGGTSGVDVGDIKNSLRFRSGASARLTRTITTDATSTYFAAVKRGRLGAISPIFDTNIRFNANNTLTAFGLTTTAVFRDPTSWLFIHVSNGGLYVNGVSYGAVTTSAITNLRIGFDGTNYFDGYMARVGVVAGSSSSYTNFGTFNTEINEWVSKTQAQVKAVVDAGGANSFMLDFDDATSLTTLGYDKSAKGNNWTCNNISLTAGVTYDHMLDVPGNSYAVLNNIFPSAANISWANLRSGTTAARGTIPCTDFNSYWEVTAGASNVTAGVIDAAASANTTTVTANKVFAFEMTTAGTIKYRNVTDSGAWTDITTGLSGARWPYGITAAADWNFGQMPFIGTPETGFKALCQRNLETPAILKPSTGFNAVINTEDNIYSSVATARSGWTDYVDILKNRAASESWAWQFSHDSTNEYAVQASSLVRQAKRAMSGVNNWVGYPLRIGGSYGTAAGSVSHTNGAATTVTHSVSKSTRQMIFLFDRAGGSAIPVYHSSATTGELLDLCTTVADAASTTLTGFLSASFQIGSGVATGTYDYLVAQEVEGYSKIGSYVGNGSADGPFVHCGFKPRYVLVKSTGATGWTVIDTARSQENLTDEMLFPHSSSQELTSPAYFTVDILSNGFKVRTTETTANTNGQSYIFMAFADVPSKFSNAR